MAGSNGRAKRHFFGGTGLYIALFLGVTALAVAGYWTLLPKNTTDKDAENVSSQVELPVQDETPQMPEAELPQEAAKPAEPVEEPPEDLIVMDEATGVEDTVPAMESETDAQPVAPRLVVAPLVGEEVAAFSVDELTYNETLGDWRTHDGIDIAAEVGTQVIAACSGVVTAVRDDDMMGTLVTIAHDDGYETTYANLRSSPGVGEGTVRLRGRGHRRGGQQLDRRVLDAGASALFGQQRWGTLRPSRISKLKIEAAQSWLSGLYF